MTRNCGMGRLSLMKRACAGLTCQTMRSRSVVVRGRASRWTSSDQRLHALHRMSCWRAACAILCSRCSRQRVCPGTAGREQLRQRPCARFLACVLRPYSRLRMRCSAHKPLLTARCVHATQRLSARCFLRHASLRCWARERCVAHNEPEVAREPHCKHSPAARRCALRVQL
jgi:hypothetical protein